MQLQRSLLPNVRVLEMIGLWPDNSTTSNNNNYYKIYTGFCVVFFLWLHTLSGAFIILVKLNGVTKCYYYLKEFETARRLLRNLNRKEFEPSNDTQNKIVSESLDFWKRLFYTFFVMSTMNLCFWGLYPFLDGSYRIKRLPFNAWYPYDYKEGFRYPLTYIYQFLSTFYVGCVNVTLDGFFTGLLAHLGAQCDILCDKLENIAVKSAGKNNREIKNDRELMNCIRHHKLVLDFSDGLSRILKDSTFVQLASTVVITCLTLLHLTLVEPFSVVFYTLINFLLCIFGELLLYCWYGEEVHSKSSKIPTVGFNYCDWVDRSESFRKRLIFFIFRSQKPIKIYALGFFGLSLEMFGTIMRSSWSYFLLLRHVHDKQLVVQE